MKLGKNTRLVHGYTKQLPTYNKSANVSKSVFLIIDVEPGHEQRINNVYRERKKDLRKNLEAPLIVLVDGCKQQSASNS